MCVSCSFVLNFAYAECLEVNQKYADVHAIYDKFLEILRRDLDALEAKVNSANSSQSSNLSGAAAVDFQSADLPMPSNNSSFATQPADEKPPKTKELSDRRTEYGLVWTMYMRFARRAEGLKSSRPVFAKARRDRWVPWEVYESAGKLP